MKKILSIKNMIKFWVTIFLLYQFFDTWVYYGTNVSPDVAVGFAVGLIFMAFLFVLVWIAGFMYDILNGLITSSENKKSQNN